jgi:hypothetical protein
MKLPSYPPKTGSFNRVGAILVAAVLATAAFFIWNVSRQQPACPLSTEPPAPAAKRFAPEGVLYLTKRATVTYESGIMGIPIGAEVQIVGPAKGGKIPVDYRGNHLLLPANQLTNDLNLVDSLIRPQRARTSVVNKNSPPPPVATSFFAEIPSRFFSLIGLWWQTLCDWIHPPPPPPPPSVDPKKVKNRHEIIRFYERTIRDLEEQMTHATVNSSNTNAPSPSSHYSVVLSSRSANQADNSARRKQIAEYKIRIAKMKAEIGE